MAWGRTGRLVTCANSPVTPAHAEWCTFVEWLQSSDFPLQESVTLVRSFGGGPDTMQRALLTDLISRSDAKPKTVILTDSALVRGLGIAFSWFNPSTRILAPERMEEGFDYLGLDSAERADGRRLLDELCERLQESGGKSS